MAKPKQQPKFTECSIDELSPDAANVRLHPERNVKATDASFRQFGPARSIVVDGKNVVRAGNRSLESAKAAGIERVLIVDPEPDQLVVVRRADWSPTEATAYAIADNRAAELAEWDQAGLAAQLQALQIDGVDLGSVGYDGSEFDFLLESVGSDAANGEPTEPAEDPGPQVDRAAELLAKWKVEPGQLWVIPSKAMPGGEHRLLCGDSTKPEDVSRVMEGKKAPLMNTDPPYGVDYAAVKNGIPRSGFRDIQEKRGDIENDDLTDGAALQAFLEAMIRAAVPVLTVNPAFYFWHPMLTQGTFFAAAAAAADILIHRQIIWVKPHFVLTRSGMYHWRHELCFYGWIRGKPCEWHGDKSQDSVWEMGESQRDRMHHTQKPVELFTRPIMNHTRAGEVVYEPFAGSGSQFVAAEQTGRLCRGIEIAPKYCSVILERLSGMELEPRLA